MATPIGAAAATLNESSETAQRFRPPRIDFRNFKPRHFVWKLDGKVATITLNRPERKNPLTLESYGELRDTIPRPRLRRRHQGVVITGAGGNFCSGGDVHEIIGPLVEMQRKGDMAGSAGVHAHDRRPGQGDARLSAADRGGGRWHLRRRRSDPGHGLRPASWNRAQQGRLSVRAGWSCRRRHGRVQYSAEDHRSRACRRAALYRPRHGRRAKAERWGFYNRLCEPEAVLSEAQALARSLADGPDLRPCHDQALHPPGMEHGHRRGDRSGGAGAGHLHADEGL